MFGKAGFGGKGKGKGCFGGYDGGYGGFGPMMGKGPAAFGGPYGFGKKGAKGKGKGKSKPKEEKPTVNANQINPNKEAFDGGISFKNILQEKISKQIGRPIAPGDIQYTVGKSPDGSGKIATVTIVCLGPEHVYEGDLPGKDDKQAGQIAASKALEAIFPEVCEQVMEAHAAGSGTMGANQPEAGAGGAAAVVDPNGEPKGCLNRKVAIAAGRPVAAGDIVYETAWHPELNCYMCTLRINALDSGDGTQVFTSDSHDCRDIKSAEKSAARIALESNAVLFDMAEQAHEEKKLTAASTNKGFKGNKGKGNKGSGKGFKGKGKGKENPNFMAVTTSFEAKVPGIQGLV